MDKEPKEIKLNKEKLKKLLIEGNLEEAKKFLTDKKEELEKKRKEDYKTYSYSIGYWHFERILEYKEKKENQWLDDYLEEGFLDDTTERIIKTALYDSYKEALEEIEEETPYSPTSSYLNSIKSIIYFYQGDIKKYFEIEEDPEKQKLFDLEGKISELVETEGKFTQAIELINKHLEKYPKDHLMLAYKGVALFKQGDTEEAKKYLKDSISSKTNRYALYYLLEISKSTGNLPDIYNYAKLLIDILEKEFSREEKRRKKKKDKVSLLDLGVPIARANAMFDIADVLAKQNRIEDSKIALLELQNYLDDIVSPLLQKSIEEDGDWYVDLYLAKKETPRTETEKLYEKTKSLYNKIEPQRQIEPAQQSNSTGWIILIVVIVVLLIIIF